MKSPSSSSPAQDEGPSVEFHEAVVLDTNVVLALWLFGDRNLSMLRQALEDGRFSWIYTAPMWSELCHEVRPELCDRYGVTPDDVYAGIARIPRRSAVAVPELPQVPAALRCSDPQDQMFLDLAYTLRPSLLLSRDRAVLRLRGKAAALDVRIDRPDVWQGPSIDAAPAKLGRVKKD